MCSFNVMVGWELVSLFIEHKYGEVMMVVYEFGGLEGDMVLSQSFDDSGCHL